MSEVNKQLADMSLTYKHKPQDFDDSRSDTSYMTSQASNYHHGPFQSNLSSAIKKPPVFANNMANDLSSSMSQISYEDGFQNAEYNALNEEDRARERREAKERKLKEFQDKTKKAANKKLQEMQQLSKLSAVEDKLKERERLMKAKDYAQKQRGLVSRKKGRDSHEESNPAGVHTNFHA